MWSRRLLPTVTILLFATLAPARAWAGNEAAAEALFEEAKRLMADGKFADACPKFAESNRLDRGAGTILHLGDCYEKNGQSASAWASYKEAASAAQAQARKDWEQLARDRAAALEPKLGRLTVKVTTPVDKLEVTRDGVALSPASFGVAIPVDAGTHVVDAAAPGFQAFHARPAVTKDGETVEIVIPALEREPSAAPPPAAVPATVARDVPAETSQPGGSGQRTAGLVVGGIGIAALAVGGVTGLVAMGKSDDAKEVCPKDGPCRDATAVDAADSARSLGLISTLGFILGGVGIGAGAVLFFSAPRDRGVSVAPQAGPGGAGVRLQGSF